MSNILSDRTLLAWIVNAKEDVKRAKNNLDTLEIEIKRRIQDEENHEPGFTYVRVVFPDCNKRYTYKVRGNGVKVGDHLVVNTRNEKDVVVRVKEIGDGGYNERDGYVRIGKVIKPSFGTTQVYE